MGCVGCDVKELGGWTRFLRLETSTFHRDFTRPIRQDIASSVPIDTPPHGGYTQPINDTTNGTTDTFTTTDSFNSHAVDAQEEALHDQELAQQTTELALYSGRPSTKELARIVASIARASTHNAQLAYTAARKNTELQVKAEHERRLKVSLYFHGRTSTTQPPSCYSRSPILGGLTLTARSTCVLF